MKSTYERFKDALRSIASGCPKAAEVAKEALRSREQEPDPNSKRRIRERLKQHARMARAGIRQERQRRAIEAFMEGRSMNSVANDLGFHPSTIAADIAEHIRENCTRNCYRTCEFRDRCALKAIAAGHVHA